MGSCIMLIGHNSHYLIHLGLDMVNKAEQSYIDNQVAISYLCQCCDYSNGRVRTMDTGCPLHHFSPNG